MVKVRVKLAQLDGTKDLCSLALRPDNHSVLPLTWPRSIQSSQIRFEAHNENGGKTQHSNVSEEKTLSTTQLPTIQRICRPTSAGKPLLELVLEPRHEEQDQEHPTDR